MPSKDPEQIIHSALPPVEHPQVPIGEYFAEQLNKHDPEEIALIDPNSNGQFTFRQIHETSQFFASGLLQLGLTAQDLVLFYADNSLEYAFAMIGTMYLNLTMSPVTPANGSFELSEQIADPEASVLIFGTEKLATVMQVLNNPKYESAVGLLKTLIVLNSEEVDQQLLEHPSLSGKVIVTFNHVMELGSGKLLQTIPFFKPTSLSKDHFLIVYTSGTTGKPKGAIHSHRSFLGWFTHTKSEVDVPGKRVLLTNAMGHLSGVIFLLSSLANGMPVVLMPSSDLDTILGVVERFQVNYLYMLPSHATPLVKVDYHKQYDLRSLEIAKYGGCRVAPNLLEAIREKYKVKLFDYYGSTEFFGHVNQNWQSIGDDFEPGNLGRLQPNIEMKIVDLKSGKSLGPNQQGEVYFRGVPCFIGYLNNPEATAGAIDADGWYHSGDIGLYDERGCLFLKDRIKELIKYKFWSVIPGELEDFLHRHEAVAAVCVVGVPHATDGQLPRAYVELVPGKTVTEQELMDYVQENIGYQKRLRGGVQFVERCPRTILGKIDRQYFKRLVASELLTHYVP